MDAFAASYRPDGVHRWSFRFGGAKANDMAFLAMGQDGVLYLAGRFSETIDLGGGPLTAVGPDQTDIVVASFDANGAHRWSMRLGGPQWDEANGIAVDAGGNLYLIGTFSGEVDFGKGPLVAQGGSDRFVLKLAY